MDASRDWGYAGDFVVAMHKMMQCFEPDDFVIGTGECHTVREFLEASCKAAGVNLDGCIVHAEAKAFARTNEIWQLRADYWKAKQTLEWEPKTTFEELVKLMVDHDLKELRAKRPA